MFNKLVTTAEKYEEDSYNGSIIEVDKQQGTLKEYQKVIAVGSSVRGVDVGDLVAIDPTRYAVKKYDKDSIRQDIEGGNPIVGYNFDFVTVDGSDCLLIEDRDIEFVITDYEEEEVEIPKKTSIIMPASDIIV
jgi:threonine dehydrogenase-like Zn-dependent dehydrogenase